MRFTVSSGQQLPKKDIMVKIEVIDKSTGEILYQYITEGNPREPTAIHESGSRLQEFRVKMNIWYDLQDDFTKDLLGCTGFSSTIYTKLDHVIDTETMEIRSEGWGEYPEEEHIPRQHGDAWGFEVF